MVKDCKKGLVTCHNIQQLISCSAAVAPADVGTNATADSQLRLMLQCLLVN